MATVRRNSLPSPNAALARTTVFSVGFKLLSKKQATDIAEINTKIVILKKTCEGIDAKDGTTESF